VALGNDSCAPGNVYSLDGSNLPGLSSPQAGIPTGISGKPTIGQFTATAGKLNVCNAGQYNDITPESHREGALLSAHYEFAKSVDLFTEILFSHKTLRIQNGPQLFEYASSGGTLSAANPYNPFGQDVNVSFTYPGTGVPEFQSTSLVRPTIGARGAVFSDWHYEATVTLSRDRFDDVKSGENSGAISAALASSDPATALNPFTGGAPGTPQLLSSLATPVATFLLDDQLVIGQGILRGPLLDLPAGALQTVIGGEYGQEKQDTTSTGSPTNNRHRNSYAAFSEARIPLLAGVEQPQSGERLTLTLAGRYDHSSDYGGKATWQGALQWRPLDTLSLTGSYGTSYEAPQLAQISGQQTTSVGPLFVTDPFRGNELALYNSIGVFGPNFNLKPETGASSSLRVAYSSDAHSGLRASLTWYDLKISNYIGFPISQTLVDYPNLFPGAVTRAPATPQDQQQGFLGVITQLNQTYYNFGDIHVDGFDADVSYAIDTRLGQFTPSLAIANVYKWQAALTPNAPTIDGVSKASIFSVGWSPRWKGTAALAWKRGPLSMNIAGRYIGRYLDYQSIISIPNTNEIGNTWIVDVSARAELGQALSGTAPWLSSAYVALGAVNVFNRIPPLSLNSYLYDLQQYDVRGRFLHLSVGVRF
jgi:iron complex outermembrane receptor protein